MIYLVDTATLEPADVDRYLDTVLSAQVPVMERAGAVFEHCRATSSDFDRPVEVEVTWSFADNDTWNAIRRNLVLDPQWHACAATLEQLRRSGARRFLRPVPSPVPR